MTDSKPLHVQVADALGWHSTYMNGFTAPWYGCPTPGAISMYVPHYDTDWSATGPLIERYGIELRLPIARGGWMASADEGPNKYGSSPLIAVCNLLLALHAAGKLKAARRSRKAANSPSRPRKKLP